jgi:glycine cleavage system H protein
MTTFYTRDHEWIDLTNADLATVGITQHAQEALGDVVFVELPKPGTTLAKGATAGFVESTKAAVDVYMPLAGEIHSVNEALTSDPSLINSDPENSGWFFKVRPLEPARRDDLLDRHAYAELLRNL